MTGVEPRTSDIESDHSTNWATTTFYGFLINFYETNPPRALLFL